ncbi:hypothetical protein UFOVP5_48 [uncultured Caudovirales phage]|uniref:LexA repressor DNA-binding domain-containing protein n=1 Tax=uncultured Caudovirales phage TaxID=2100421 RepID=A0A6J5KH58_9CAUD|nr:hypothetical protein UFOVP5_48 [uncultured Caudovirales phage]
MTCIDSLSHYDRAIYAELVRATEAGEVCPNYLDLNEVAGYESASSSAHSVARLERLGLVCVRRYQRFREVQIVATGKWTARHPSMHVERPHVPRGSISRGPRPTDRKGYKTRRPTNEPA